MGQQGPIFSEISPILRKVRPRCAALCRVSSLPLLHLSHRFTDLSAVSASPAVLMTLKLPSVSNTMAAMSSILLIPADRIAASISLHVTRSSCTASSR